MTKFDASLIRKCKDGYQCCYCQLKLKTRGGIKVHVERIHLISQFAHKCKLCSKVFGHVRNFACHLFRVHKLPSTKKAIEANRELIPNPKL